MNRTPQKYAWPASALTPTEMSMLYHARQNKRQKEHKHVPISKLVAEAVRQTYGIHADLLPEGE